MRRSHCHCGLNCRKDWVRTQLLQVFHDLVEVIRSSTDERRILTKSVHR